MDKNELIKRFASDDEDKLMLAQVLDKLEAMEAKNTLTFTRFLNERQRDTAEKLLNSCGKPRHAYIPAYEGAARTVLVFLPDYMEPDKLLESAVSPITCIRASYSQANEPGHRDFLGSLMGCGIKRETIGDIMVGKGSCDIVVMKDILPYLLTNFESAGRVKLSISEMAFEDISVPETAFKPVKDTVASLRLDSIVSAGFSISRDTAASAIKSGRVTLKHQVCVKPDKPVEEGDSISLRGMGKIELSEVGKVTKKGRTAIVLKRYV